MCTQQVNLATYFYKRCVRFLSELGNYSRLSVSLRTEPGNTSKFDV